MDNDRSILAKRAPSRSRAIRTPPAPSIWHHRSGTIEQHAARDRDPATARDRPAARVAGSERPGEWNTIDIICQSGEAQHLLNGEPVSGGFGFTLQWPGEPATALQRGKLQIQSEGAEIYYRRIELLPLR